MPNDLAPELLSQDVCAPWELSGDCSPPIVGLGSGCASAGQDGGGTSVAIARVQHCTPPTDLCMYDLVECVQVKESGSGGGDPGDGQKIASDSPILSRNRAAMMQGRPITIG